MKANHHLLPISPHLLLEGIFFHDLSENAKLGPIKTDYRFDTVFASVIAEIICSRKREDIPEAMARASTSGVKFLTVEGPERIFEAGLKQSSEILNFRVVTTDEYVRFIHSFIRPPSIAV